MKELLHKYFPNLTETQFSRFEKMAGLFRHYNEKVNVVSRRDIENIEINHILHSLGIAKFINFTEGSRIIDLGTGGGLPGLPLAVMFPGVNFHLIDRIGKKVKVASDIAGELDLRNVTFQHGDMGECHEKFDFVVSRAVTDQDKLLKIIKNNISSINKNAIPNGLITLKGGNLDSELSGIKKSTEVIELSQYFNEPFFETKKLVYTQI